jgi:O-antigen/teichoic acid export membrane protein
VDPGVRGCRRESALILAQTPASVKRLPPSAARRAEVYPAVGMEPIADDCAALAPHPGFRVVSAGNLLYFKGAELGLRAFAAAAPELPLQSCFWILGDGPERQKLERLAAQLGIAPQVCFCGQLPRAEVLRRLRQADVFLHCAWRDPPVCAVLEAMAAGLPVVCLDNGGPAAQVPPGTGIRIPPAGARTLPAELGAALLRLARDPQYRLQLGRQAAAHARQHYLWERKGEVIAEFYRRAAAAPAPSRLLRAPRLRVAGNAAVTAASAGFSVLLAILVTPFMLARLQSDGYGVYVLLATLVGYYGLLDLGVSQALSRTVARRQAKEERDPLAEAINTALALQAVAGTFACVALAALAPRFVLLLKVPPQLQPAAAAALRLAGLAFLLSTLSNVFRSVIAGLERYGCLALMDSLAATLSTAGTVMALRAGGGLFSISLVSAGVAALSLAAYGSVVSHVLGRGWRWRPRVCRRAMRDLLGFGCFLSLGRIAQTTSTTSIRVLLAALFGPAAVAQYVIPQRVIQGLGMLLTSGASVLFPHASRVAKQAAWQRVQALYCRASLAFSALAFPGLMALAALAEQILTVWIGPEFAAQNWRLMQWLCFAALLGSLSTVPINFACQFAAGGRRGRDLGRAARRRFRLAVRLRSLAPGELLDYPPPPGSAGAGVWGAGVGARRPGQRAAVCGLAARDRKLGHEFLERVAGALAGRSAVLYPGHFPAAQKSAAPVMCTTCAFWW